MTEPLRVLQVLTSLDRGGIETMTMNYYRHMDRSLVQFDFLLHREWEGGYEEEARSLGARIYRVPRQNPLNLRYWSALDKFFTEHPYRVVHAQLDCMSALPLMPAKKHGSTIRIAHSHSSRQDWDMKYPIKAVCKHFIAIEATELFACGVDSGRWMFGSNDFTVIQNAIDINKFAFNRGRREKVRAELCIEPSMTVVGHVGRFVPVKNHAFILEVFSKLLRSSQNSILLLIGDGELRPEVEHRASELGIYNSVRFLGEREDVYDLMQAMDVFLMPSIYEGFPLVLVEAQASGLPCLISSKIPSECEIIPKQVKRLEVKSSATKWAETLIDCKNIIDNRYESAEIVRRAGFDIDEAARALQSFYLRGAWNRPNE